MGGGRGGRRSGGRSGGRSGVSECGGGGYNGGVYGGRVLDVGGGWKRVSGYGRGYRRGAVDPCAVASCDTLGVEITGLTDRTASSDGSGAFEAIWVCASYGGTC